MATPTQPAPEGDKNPECDKKSTAVNVNVYVSALPDRVLKIFNHQVAL